MIDNYIYCGEISYLTISCKPVAVTLLFRLSFEQKTITNIMMYRCVFFSTKFNFICSFFINLHTTDFFPLSALASSSGFLFDNIYIHACVHSGELCMYRGLHVYSRSSLPLLQTLNKKKEKKM